MLTRCPACETHFRVTAEQLRARSGRVRCGQCQHVFNALDSLIEVPMAGPGPLPARTRELRPTPYVSAAAEGEAAGRSGGTLDVVLPPAPAGEPLPAALDEGEAAQPGQHAAQVAEAADPVAFEARPTEVVTPEGAAREAVAPDVAMPETGASEAVASETRPPEPESAAEIATDAGDGSETFPEPAPAPRRWPWVIGSLTALTALVLQATLAFRVELAVLWPEARPVLLALCGIANCEIGLPAKIALVGIEASDLHPDSEHVGRLALTATLKSRAPFAQQFPHLELTLTDTMDKAVARKVLAPADYLPPQVSLAQGMQPNTDIAVAVGVELREISASGYRLYVFYP